HRELQRQPDAQGSGDTHTLQHLHRAGAAPGADLQPRALGVASRDSPGRRAVYLFRRSRRRYARVQHKPRRAQPRREPLSARTPPQASDGLIFEGRRETSMDAKGLKADVPSGKPASPYRLIDETALRWHRRRLSELLLPVLPPVLAAAIALAADRLPVEIGVAGTI